jgi:hypothetical protein
MQPRVVNLSSARLRMGSMCHNTICHNTICRHTSTWLAGGQWSKPPWCWQTARGHDSRHPCKQLLGVPTPAVLVVPTTRQDVGL